MQEPGTWFQSQELEWNLKANNNQCHNNHLDTRDSFPWISSDKNLVLVALLFFWRIYHQCVFHHAHNHKGSTLLNILGVKIQNYFWNFIENQYFIPSQIQTRKISWKVRNSNATFDMMFASFIVQQNTDSKLQQYKLLWIIEGRSRIPAEIYPVIKIRALVS